MIQVTAIGFIAEKPELQLVGAKRQRKCEFDVVWGRRDFAKRETVWERATFFAWDDEAQRLAEMLDKGADVKCVGMQETYTWTPPNETRKRRIVKYRLVWWEKVYRAAPERGDGTGAAQAARGDRGATSNRARAGDDPFPYPGEDAAAGSSSHGERQFIQM